MHSITPLLLPALAMDLLGWDTEGGWGYGKNPETMDEFYPRCQGQVDALLDSLKTRSLF